MKRLNIKLAISLFVCLLVLGVGVHVLHAIQVERNAEGVLEQARALYEKRDLDQALQFAGRYLNLRENDVEGMKLAANITYDIAQAPDAHVSRKVRALAYMEAAVRLDQDDNALRRKLLEYLIDLGSITNALDHIKLLRAAGSFDAELEVLAAKCQVATGDYGGSAKICETLIGYDPIGKTFADDPPAPNQVDAYAILAQLYREKKVGTDEQADAVIDKMVTLNEKSTKAHLAAHFYWKRYQNKINADQSLDVAFELDPESSDVVVPMVERAIDDKKLDEAETLLRGAIEKYPNDERLYRGMALVELRRRQLPAAIEALEQGLARVPDSFVLYNALLGLQLQQDDIAPAKATFKKLKELGFSSAILDVYESQFLMRDRKWREAIEKLERAENRLVHDQAMVAQVRMLLGKCNQAIGDNKEAIAIYDDLARKTAGLTEATVLRAGVLASTGKNEEALQEFERIAANLGEEQLLNSPQVWRQLLNLRTWDQIRQPKEKRDWSKVDSLVEQLKAADKLSELDKVFLDGELLAKKGDLEAARSNYAAALADNPTNETLWARRIEVELQIDGPDAALRVAESAPAEMQDGLAMRLLRAGVFSRMDADTAKAGLRSIEKGMDKLKADEQYLLLHGLVQEHRRSGDRESAKRLIAQMIEQRPNDIIGHVLRFEIALDQGDVETMQVTAREVRRLSDPQRPQPALLDAITKIVAVKQAHLEDLTARKLDLNLSEAEKASLHLAQEALEELVKGNANWNEPHKWLADIHGLLNNPAGVISELLSANRKGQLDQARTRQLHDLLVESGRHEEADEVYKGLSGRGTHGSGWARAESLIQGKRFEEAKQLLVTLKPKENATTADRLRYAQANRQINELAEAEAALREAIEADPASASAWVLLVTTLVTAERLNDAEAVVENAKVRLPAEERELVLAQCYEVMRDAKRAEQSFQKFYNEQPESLAANKAIAGFYLRANKLADANKYLDFILKKGAASTVAADKQAVEWARRARAVVLASEGSWQRFQEAEAMLRQNISEATTSDLALRIGLMANRTEPASLRAALALFEELQRRQPLQLNDQAQMARLYERVGQWRKAKEMMINLLGQRNVDPQYYLGYAEMLLRNREYNEAENWLDQYDQIRRDGMSLPIRITLQVRQGRQREAVDLVNRLIGPPPWPAGKRSQVKAVANILQQLRLYADAEKIWREYAKADPEATLTLARCVGMHGDLDEAFALLETAGKHHPPLEILGVGMQILRARKGESQDKHFKELARWYQAARQADQNSPYLQMLMGDIREIRGELEKAEDVYRKVLARTDLAPHMRAAISNNLAFILSTQNRNTEESLKLIDGAMEVIGPSSDLLDTRGIVYLAAGRNEEALADFQEAILIPTAMKWVHMAFAQSALGDIEAARASLKKAQELDLKREDLYAAEWTRYEGLAAQLGL